MFSGFNSIIEVFESFGSLFSWLPEPLGSICGIVVLVAFLWSVLGIIRSIIGTFL